MGGAYDFIIVLGETLLDSIEMKLTYPNWHLTIIHWWKEHWNQDVYHHLLKPR